MAFEAVIERQTARPVNWLRVAVPLSLGAILLLQTVIAINLRNTAFQDEALYLYAGRQYFSFLQGGPAVVEPYGQYFSGLPYLYPLIAGALDSLGGLEAARLFSLACMLLTTVAVYLVGEYLYGVESGVTAAALFSIQGTVLFLSHFATFDAMCLALVAWATVLSLRGNRIKAIALGPGIGLLLALAVATKYAGLLFIPPVIALLIWQSKRAYGWRYALIRAVSAIALIRFPRKLKTAAQATRARHMASKVAKWLRNKTVP